MLRETFRVLKPGGRAAGYVIHSPEGLSPDLQRRANDLGPSKTTAPASPEKLAESAGFSVIVQTDVTASFRQTAVSMLEGRIGLEDSLRAEEGDEAYEEECRKKRNKIQGIDEGLLLRSLTVVEKPG